MKLFQISGGSLDEVDVNSFLLEKDIQQLIESNVQAAFGLTMIQSEFAVDKYRIDTLCYNETTNSFVIIEYKKGSSYSVIDQGFSYYQLMLNNKHVFVLALSKHLNKVLDISDIDWGESKIIFVAPSFNAYQKDSVNFKNLPFELWEIQRYQNNCLTLNQHITTSTASIGNVTPSLSTSPKSGAIPVEMTEYTFEEHYRRTSQRILDKFEDLRERIEELSGDVELVPKKPYISLIYQKTTICYFNFKKNRISIDILRGNENTDGVKSKKFFNMEDPKRLSTEGNWVWKTGVKGHYYNITLDEKTDTEYLMYLLSQKYQALKG